MSPHFDRWVGSQTALAQPLPACCTVLDKSNETHALQLLIVLRVIRDTTI